MKFVYRERMCVQREKWCVWMCVERVGVCRGRGGREYERMCVKYGDHDVEKSSLSLSLSLNIYIYPSLFPSLPPPFSLLFLSLSLSLPSSLPPSLPLPHTYTHITHTHKHTNAPYQRQRVPAADTRKFDSRPLKSAPKGQYQ